jgi:hypothetical protein
MDLCCNFVLRSNTFHRMANCVLTVCVTEASAEKRPHYLASSGAKIIPIGPISRILAYDDLDISRALAV